MAIYAVAVLIGLTGLAGARHASDRTMQEGGFILLAILAVAWLAVLALLYLARKSDDRHPRRYTRHRGRNFFVAAV